MHIAAAEICLGLYVLHANKILHRDVKAANIFVGENDRIMLGDLGIAKLAKSDGLAAKTQIGTNASRYVALAMFKLLYGIELLV